ncbi:MAG: helix-turn-helix transcriptional regulator [candidate division NC10 bacterium]|nr:helix-turn-helix transcriptional regulator [candidate division NC10 bacterium]
MIIIMPLKTIAQQVQTWREHRELSQRALAKAAGVAPVLVQKIEAGAIVDPRLSSLRKLAGALGVTVGELVDGSPAKAKKRPTKRAGR